MSQWVKCLLCKQEDLYGSPTHTYKKLGWSNLSPVVPVKCLSFAVKHQNTTSEVCVRARVCGRGDGQGSVREPTDRNGKEISKCNHSI